MKCRHDREAIDCPECNELRGALTTLANAQTKLTEALIVLTQQVGALTVDADKLHNEMRQFRENIEKFLRGDRPNGKRPDGK